MYIIECKDDSDYTGMTWMPDLRYDQHVSGLGGKYTRRYGVKRIAYIEKHDDLEIARKKEKQIKDWNREKRKN